MCGTIGRAIVVKVASAGVVTAVAATAAVARAGVVAAAAMEVDMEVDMVAGRPRGAMEVMVAEDTVVATAGAHLKGTVEAMVEAVAAASATTTLELD